MTVRGPYGYTSGLNTKAGPYDLGQNQYSTGTDIEIEYGHLVPRLSFQNWSSGTHPGGNNPINVGFWLGKNVIGVGGGKIATTSVVQGGAWSDITGSVTVSSTAELAGNIGFTILNSILVITDGVNPPIQWTGSGNCAVLAGSPPSGALGCTMANNYVFLGPTSTNGSRVQWSAVGDPQTWPATNFVDFRKKDGDTVTAIIHFGEDLVIFKNYSMGRLYTTQNTGITNGLGPLVTISEKIGCANTNCVDRLPDGRLVWIGTDNHAYMYDGSIIMDISDQSPPQSNIQTTFDGLSFRSAGFSCVKVYKKKHQVWFANYLATNNPIYIYDYLLGQWIYSSTMGSNPVYSLVNTNTLGSTPLATEYLIAGGANGNSYQMDTSSNPLVAPTPIMAINIPIGAGGRDFIPRSAMFPIEVSANCSGTVTWFYDSSGTTFNKTFSYTTTGSKRLIIPITWQQKASYVNINVTFTSQVGNSWKLFPYYISDEVLI